MVYRLASVLLCFGSVTLLPLAGHADEIAVNASTVLSSDLSGFDVFVGKNNLNSFAVEIATGTVITGDNNFSNGYNGLRVGSNSTVNLTGGTVSNAYLTEGGTLNMSGGTLSFLQTSSFYARTITVSGGHFGGAFIFGGLLDVKGGAFLSTDSLLNFGGELRFTGQNLTLTPASADADNTTDYQLSGTLISGEQISARIYDSKSGQGIVLVNAPEPTSLALPILCFAILPLHRFYVTTKRAIIPIPSVEGKEN